jgi:hypothetical protein
MKDLLKKASPITWDTISYLEKPNGFTEKVLLEYGTLYA